MPRARTLDATPRRAPGTIRFNFDRTDLRQALAVILGDTLGRPYSIDPDVTGELTFVTATPLSTPEVLPALRTVLTGYGLTLLEGEGGVVRVARSGAPGTTGPGSAPEGRATVFAPDYADAESLARVLLPLLPAERVTAVPDGNLLVATGTEAELALVRDAVAAFDIDPLAGRPMMLVGLDHADPEELAAELTGLYGGAPTAEGAAIPDLPGGLRVIPVPRLAAVILVARDEGQLDRAYGWAKRLDRPRPPGARRLFVVPVENRKAADLAAALTGLYAPAEGEPPDRAAERPRIVVDEANNALLINASFAEWEGMRDALARLDQEPLQVLVEASILEVTLGNTLRFGVQYAIDTGDLFGSGDSGLTLTRATQGLGLAPQVPGFLFAIGSPARPEVLIDALDAETDITVVSSPKLLVLDNQVARLTVGDSVPIVTQQTTSTQTNTPLIVNSVEYRDTGVTLEVTPRVNASGLVTLDISQEVSDVVETTTSGIDSPTIRQRRLLTSVGIRSGETVLLGGLIRDRDEDADTGIPLLQDIPLVGGLFRTTSRIDGRTELLALLTPHVIRRAEEAVDVTAQIRRRYEAVLARVDRPRTFDLPEEVELTGPAP